MIGDNRIITNQPTPVILTSDVSYVGSPKHISVGSSTFDTNQTYYTFDTIDLKIWVWSGDLLKPYTNSSIADFTIIKKKVSSTDSNIIVDIGDYIRTRLNPKLSFDYSIIETLDEGVYYQYEIDIYNGSVKQETLYSTTKFATLGWNWNFEGEAPYNNYVNSFGFYDSNVIKNYYKYVTYTDGDIFIGGATSSTNMIARTQHITTPEEEVCSNQPIIIAYLDKRGLWNTFSITGKVIIENKMSKELYNKGTRNPIIESRSSFHSMTNFNKQYKESFTINTGLIKERTGQYIEEIICSSKIYLIVFRDEIKEGNIGVTADSTLITADSTLYTADMTGFFGTVTNFYQLPVVVNTSDFVRKTSYNDKAKISYTIKFDVANNKMNNLR